MNNCVLRVHILHVVDLDPAIKLLIICQGRLGLQSHGFETVQLLYLCYVFTFAGLQCTYEKEATCSQYRQTIHISNEDFYPDKT